MITASLTDANGTVNLPAIEQQFLNKNIENATDVITLAGDIYTDFVNQKTQWTFNYDSLTEDQYEAIRAVYDSQFTLLTYPTLNIPYYSFSASCRMYINDKDIWNHCGDVQDVTLTFRETGQTGSS